MDFAEFVSWLYAGTPSCPASAERAGPLAIVCDGDAYTVLKAALQECGCDSSQPLRERLTVADMQRMAG